MLRTIRLEGALGEEFGNEFQFHVNSIFEAFQALCQLKGFREAIRQGQYQITRKNGDSEIIMPQGCLRIGLGNAEEIIITPVVAGSGTELIIAGIILGALAIGGAFTPKIDDYGSRETADERPSFLFNNRVNTSEQGAAIPVVYGEITTGSVVVSSGIATEDFDG